jgi:hypothetical protein
LDEFFVKRFTESRKGEVMFNEYGNMTNENIIEAINDAINTGALREILDECEDMVEVRAMIGFITSVVNTDLVACLVHMQMEMRKEK